MCRLPARLTTLISVLFIFATTTTVEAQTTYFPAQGVFNGFLSQMNVVECDNGNSQAVNMTLRMRRSDGVELAVQAVTIEASGSQHIILNGLANIVDSLGIYDLELPPGEAFLGDKINCRTSFYRPTIPGSFKTFEYAYALPVRNPQVGSLAGIYNSFDPAGLSATTFNWLSVINFDKTGFDAVVDIYDIAGTVIRQVNIDNLPAGGRMDIPLGHTEGQVTGLYRIRPTDVSHSYDATVIRYNPNAFGGFNFAFPLRALPGTCSSEPLLASTMGNGLTNNWLEMANVNDFSIAVTVEVRDRFGVLLHSERRTIPPFGQSHMYLSSLIDPNKLGNVGSARVICDDPTDKLIIQSTLYGHLPTATGQLSPVEWAYSTQAAGASAAGKNASISAPVNTFVGMANWLKLADSSLQPADIHFTAFNQAGNAVASGTNFLSGGGTIDIGAHAMLPPDQIGSIQTTTDSDTAAYRGEILRVLSRIDGQIGNIMSIPAIVQQNGVTGVGGLGFRGDPQSLAPYRELLTQDEASHLVHRAAFGGNLAESNRVRNEGLRAAVNRLSTVVDTPVIDAEAWNWIDGDSSPESNPSTRWEGVRRTWLYHIRYSPNGLREKMALVLHDLFATSCRVINGSTGERERCWEHVQLLRSHAFGNFRSLLQSMTVDYGMLVWLNNNLNQKEQPDENYAREHWELFSTGEPFKEGGRYPRYTDEDVKEAARAFTGWTTLNVGGVPSAVFVQDRHDQGVKTLWSGTPYEVSGNFNYEDITNLTLDRRPEPAQFIARRIFVAFVHDHPSRQVVNQLAEILKENNFELLPLLRTILRSEAFFSPDARFQRIKNPVQYLVGFLKRTDMHYRLDRLDSALCGMGMCITDPPDVNGWPGNKHKEAAETDFFLAWTPQYANNITEVFRRRSDFNSSEGNPNDFELRLPHPLASGEEVVDHLVAMLNVPITQEERTEFINYMNTAYNSSLEPFEREFDPTSSTHVREKVSGLLWILSQHEQYVTH